MRHAIRLAGPLTGLVLAALVGVTPVLAATVPPVTAGAPNPAEELNVRLYCKQEWLAAKAEPTVANLQAVGRCEIDRRLETLERLQPASTTRALTDAHEAALEAILARSAAGLRALRAEIDGDTTVSSCARTSGGSSRTSASTPSSPARSGSCRGRRRRRRRRHRV